MFYQTVVVSAVLYGVVCWGNRITTKGTNRLQKLMDTFASVVGEGVRSVKTLEEGKTSIILEAILKYKRNPLHMPRASQRSSCSERLMSLRCRMERFGWSFPHAMRLVPVSATTYQTD